VTRRTDRPTRPNLKNKSTGASGGGEGHEICSGVFSLDVVVGMGGGVAVGKVVYTSKWRAKPMAELPVSGELVDGWDGWSGVLEPCPSSSYALC